jgi:cyanophycinase
MRLTRASTPIRRHHVLLLTAVALVVAGVVFVASSDLWPRRLVRGTESAAYQYLLVGNEADVVTPTRPGFLLEGGGTDIDESFRWLIERSGGGDFLVIRTSGTDAYNDYIFAMRTATGLRVDSAATLIVRTREAASDPFVIQTIRNAEALWLAGGDQAKHVAFWRGTPVEDALHELVARGVPVGGTSSGLAVIDEHIYSNEADARDDPPLTSTAALLDPFHPRLTLRKDFLHLPNLHGTILEPHFDQQSRYGRMAASLARIGLECPDARGIGIDCETALLVEPDGSALVITGLGHSFGRVSLMRLAGPPEVIEPGRPLTARRIHVMQFGHGDCIDLRSWTGKPQFAFRYLIEAGSPEVIRLPE